MLYSLLLVILMLSPFGEQVNFSVHNDSNEIVSLQVENMPYLTLAPESISELRMSHHQKVYYVMESERFLLFEVDKTYDEKQIHLKKLIKQATN